MSQIDFTGRVAIVTGAGGGLGRLHALALAERGAKVVVNDLGGAVDGSGGSATAAERVVEEIRARGGQAMASGASVTDFEAMQALVQQALDAWGRIDALVCNAGILRDKSFAKMDLADFRLVLDVHLMGAVHLVKAAWPHMVAQKYGRILMTTSSTGLYGNFGQSNYGAAKLALVGLMQTLALEGAKHDIRVNCLAPEVAPTGGLAGLAEDGFEERIGLMIPMGRPGHVDEVAGAAVFLASALSSYVTGQTIHVDGGTAAAGGWYHHPHDGRDVLGAP